MMKYVSSSSHGLAFPMLDEFLENFNMYVNSSFVIVLQYSDNPDCFHSK